MEDKTFKEPKVNNKCFLKNKKTITLLMVAIFWVMAGIIAGGSFIVPKNIAGAWELMVNPEVTASTTDEIPENEKAYYVFDKPDRYGRGEYHTCYQGGVEYYEYELSENDGVKKINLGAENMEYSITGSKLFGNARLTVIYPEYTDESTGVTYKAEKYIFAQAKDPEYEKESYNDFKTDSALLGEKWTSNERSVTYYYYKIPYTQSVEFLNDGIMVIHYESKDLALDRYMYYAYSAENSELTFSLVTDKDVKYIIDYDFDDEDNLEFRDDPTSDSIFADAFFGSFVYYSSLNLSAPSLASEDEMYLIE